MRWLAALAVVLLCSTRADAQPQGWRPITDLDRKFAIDDKACDRTPSQPLPEGLPTPLSKPRPVPVPGKYVECMRERGWTPR